MRNSLEICYGLMPCLPSLSFETSVPVQIDVPKPQNFRVNGMLASAMSGFLRRDLALLE